MGSAVRFLNDVPLAGLMLVVFLGFLLGRARWHHLALGPAGGTLIVALVLGAAGLGLRNLYGTDAPAVSIGSFGFSLFIFSVGYEAGPRFFSSLRRGPGWRFVLVGNVVNVLAVAVALGCGALFGLGGAASAGALAGAMTSAPTYAAAAEVLPDPSILSVSFALTYPIGLVVLVLLVQLLPKWMGDDLADDDPDDEERRPSPDPEMTRVYEVTSPDVVDRTLGEVELGRKTGCVASRLHRGEETLVPGADTRLRRGDHLLVTGRLAELESLARLVGPEVYDDDLRRRLPAPQRVLVMSADAVGRTLAELDLIRRHRCLVVHIRRHDVTVEAGADVVLERGDVLEVVGPKRGVRAAAEALGSLETPHFEYAPVVYAGGIVLGRLMGQIRLPLPGLDVRLGAAGGLLIAGLLLGRLRRLGRFRIDVPTSARRLVRDLGILLFMAETGLRSGSGVFADLGGTLAVTLVTGLAATVLPVALAVLVARRLLKLRPVDAWGSVCGGMTSSAALTAVRQAAGGREPAISYSAAFAVSSVVVTIAGQFVAALL